MTMSESRLFKILYYLLANKRATAPELASEFEVSIRTIYRDIDALSGAGIPIYAEVGRNGGIRLLDDFVLDKVLLSEQEKQDLLISLQSVMLTGTRSQNEVITKLSALFRMNVDEWIEIDFSRWGNKTIDKDKYEVLETAVLQHRIVLITYVNSYGKQSERKIEPLKLSYKSKAWYVKAFCREKGAFRIFKFHRILKIQLLDEEFIPVSYPEEPVDDANYNAVQIRFDKDMSYRIYDEFDESQIEKDTYGDFIVTARLPEDNWLIEYLLSFGAQAEVIYPTYLKEVIAQQAKEIYEKNKS